MADFSKEWCELNDPNIPNDFSILEIAEGLEPGHYVDVICEGFGFLAIQKNKEGNVLLAMPNEDDTITWKPYNEVVI